MPVWPAQTCTLKCQPSCYIGTATPGQLSQQRPSSPQQHTNMRSQTWETQSTDQSQPSAAPSMHRSARQHNNSSTAASAQMGLKHHVCVTSSHHTHTAATAATAVPARLQCTGQANICHDMNLGMDGTSTHLAGHTAPLLLKARQLTPVE
jgi:hypothetical protein